MISAPVIPEHIEVCGKLIKYRFIQNKYWSIIIALCGAAFLAGIYFNVFEVNWHIFYLKHWWDSGMGVFKSASWTLYRHGFRDFGEPALATMALKTVMANRHWWNAKVGALRLITAPIILTAIAIGLITGAVYLKYFVIPNPDTIHVSSAWLQSWLPGAVSTAETLGFGTLIGLFLHRFWAPVGATIQGFLIKKMSWTTGNRDYPVWVEYPVAPPVIRERAAWENLFKVHRRSDIPKWLKILRIAGMIVLVIVLLIIVYLAITGFIAHFWIGSGHNFPFLAPGN